MSKLARILTLGAMLAATNLGSMTAIAHANDQAASTHDGPRPPTERQVGESWRHDQAASQQQAAADTAHRRELAREHSSIPSGTPAQVPAPPSAEPSGTPGGWLLASLGVLAAALALVGGLAVLAAKRAGRRARIRHAA